MLKCFARPFTFSCRPRACDFIFLCLCDVVPMPGVAIFCCLVYPESFRWVWTCPTTPHQKLLNHAPQLYDIPSLDTNGQFIFQACAIKLVRPPYWIEWEWLLYPAVSAIDGHKARTSTIPSLEPVLPNDLKAESASKYEENMMHELLHLPPHSPSGWSSRRRASSNSGMTFGPYSQLSDNSPTLIHLPLGRRRPTINVLAWRILKFFVWAPIVAKHPNIPQKWLRSLTETLSFRSKHSSYLPPLGAVTLSLLPPQPPHGSRWPIVGCCPPFCWCHIFLMLSWVY